MSAIASQSASHDTPDHAHLPVDACLRAPSRLAALRATGLLDGTSNAVLDRLTRLVTRLLGVPIALVSLVDDEGQHFPGLTGLGGWAGGRRGTPLSHSFCQHVVTTDAPLLVRDASHDPRLRVNGAYRELGVVAYAGVPLRSADGHTLGALCAIDTQPVEWTPAQVEVLEDLAAAAMAEIELRRTVRDLVAAQLRLQSMITRDELTGLLNRRGFSEHASQHLAVAERTGASFLIVVVDLDGFKTINDAFGHDEGDAALIEISALLRSTCRASDILARLGVDEFVLLCSNSGVDEMHRVRERVYDVIERRNQQVGVERRLTASIGISAWTARHPKTLAQLQRLADESMYADKRARRERLEAMEGVRP